MSSFATSYIPTTTAQATRAADTAVITGANFSTWYNQSEGTFYSEVLDANGSARAITFSDSTINNQAWLRSALAGTSALEVYTAGSFVAQIGLVVVGNAKTAGTLKANDFAVSVNGASVVTDTSGAIGSYNKAHIGSNYDGSGAFLNGHIKTIRYFNTRLTNAQLQLLTTP